MAGGITEAVLEEIKARTDLADLIASYGIQIKSAGSSKKACCPFHNEKTPSFNINETRGYYHCFGCGESGDAIKFVQKMEGLSFPDAVRKLASACGVEIKEAKEDPAAGRRSRLYSLMSELAAFYHRCLLKMKEAAPAREYLVSRELDEKIQEEYIVGYAPNGAAVMLKWAEKYGYTAAEMEEAGVIRAPSRPGDSGYHRFGGRLMFTIHDKRGRVVGFSGRQLVASKNSGKYVNSPETPIFKKSYVLYGFDKASRAIAKDPRHEAIVCEGQIDCIRLQTSGFPNSVAGQGTAFTAEHVKMLKSLADQVALVYDDDAAGHKATIKSARLCLAEGLAVRTVSLPGGDDPDSFLRSHPAEEFRRMLDDAESIVFFQVRTERAKEKNPDSVDAVNRVVGAVLETIAQCPNAVMRASMTGEAAKLTGIPLSALTSELDKAVENARIRDSRAAARQTAKRIAPEPAENTDDRDLPAPEDGQDDITPIPGENAAVAPPPPAEIAFCAFLIGNEYDRTLAEMAGKFLPEQVFAHDFTVRFFRTWLDETASGNDGFSDFAGRLSQDDRKWLDSVLLESSKADASEQSATDNMQEFIRRLWSDVLLRRRGGLPAAGGEEAESERLRLSITAKRLATVRWNTVKDIIQQEMARQNADGKA